MTIKDALHTFIEEHWDEFLTKHHLTEVEQAAPPTPPLLPPHPDFRDLPVNSRPTADTAPVIEQEPMPTEIADPHGSLDPMEEVLSDGATVEPRPTPPKQRAVRTPLSGDKVYVIDDATMTKKWMRTPDQLKDAGFTLGEVQKIDDAELAKYKLSL